MDASRGPDCQKCTLSVITYVFVSSNNGRYELLRECLESVQNQGFDDYEHVIVDDGSTVPLTELVGSYPRTRLLKKTQSGILSSTYTFNSGILEARGRYLILLPSDDLAIPGGYASLVTQLEASGDDAVIGKIHSLSGSTISIWEPPEPNQLRDLILEANYVHGCAIMWRKDVVLPLGLPPHRAGFVADYYLFGQIARFLRVGVVDVPVAVYRTVTDSTRHKTRMKQALSLRAADRLHFQYSKGARLAFVKDSLRAAPSTFSCRSANEVAFHVKNRLSLSEFRLAARFLGSFQRDKLSTFVKESSLASEHALLERLAEANTEVVFQDLTIETLCLVNASTLSGGFSVQYGGPMSSWLFEYLCLPELRTIYDEDRTPRKDVMDFVGLGSPEFLSLLK